MLVTATAVARAIGFIVDFLRTNASRRRQRMRSAAPCATPDWGSALTASVDTSSFNLSAIPEKPTTRRPEARSDPEPVSGRGPAAETAQFRIQFVCAATDSSLVLKEVGIEAADASGAIVTAATLSFPPRTVGLRILDR